MNWNLIIIGGALLVCSAFASASGPTGNADNNAKQRIFIDPETGERRPPNAEERARMQSEATAKRRVGDSKTRMIEGPDGSEMIIHDQRDWPKLRSGAKDGNKNNASPQ